MVYGSIDCGKNITTHEKFVKMVRVQPSSSLPLLWLLS